MMRFVVQNRARWAWLTIAVGVALGISIAVVNSRLEEPREMATAPDDSIGRETIAADSETAGHEMQAAYQSVTEAAASNDDPRAISYQQATPANDETPGEQQQSILETPLIIPTNAQSPEDKQDNLQNHAQSFDSESSAASVDEETAANVKQMVEEDSAQTKSGEAEPSEESEKPAAEEASSEEASTEAASSEETPAEEMPAEETSADNKKSADPSPSEGEPEQETPPTETSSETAKEPAEKNSAASSEDSQDSAPATLPNDSEAPPASPLQSETQDEIAPNPPIEGADLQGIRPGKTTYKELHAQWGAAKEVENGANVIRETFELESVGRVRVMILKDVVDGLSLQPEEPLEIEPIAARFKLTDIEPVDVLDEQGRMIGASYPERGVMLGYEPHTDPPQVIQVVIEPIDIAPFLARAETRLQNRYAACMADLKQVLALDPHNGRAHWLHAKLTLRAGDLEQALRSARKALELDPKEVEYRLTLANILTETGDFPQAIRMVRDVIEEAEASDTLLARAHCQWGDYLVASAERDYTEAMKHHTQAIQIANTLSDDRAWMIRRGAKEVLFDANLAVARDIGWGRWKQKSQVVPKWIERAMIVAEDLIANEHGSPELRLRGHELALAALAGIEEPPDPNPWIRNMLQLGKKMLAEAEDKTYKADLAWHLGLAMYEAMEVEASRHQVEKAIALGRGAITHLDQGEPISKQLPTHDYTRGRLFYRLGAILAVEQADHRQAIIWFDRAVPLLESPVPSYAIDSGRQGETFVSMAVTYWEENDHREALRLCSQGVKLMEQAVRDGLLQKTALAIPYGNLAHMHEQLGNVPEAKKYAELTSRYETSAQDSTAKDPGFKKSTAK